MGSWDGTCGVSNLPITAGTKIVALIIGFPKVGVETYPSNGFSQICRKATPLSVPIIGKYDGYGGIYEIDCDCEYVFEIMKEQEQFSIPKDTSVIEWVNSWSNSERIKLKSDDHKLIGGLWMVRKAIYDSFCDLKKQSYFDEKSLTYIELVKQDSEYLKEYLLNIDRDALELASGLRKRTDEDDDKIKSDNYFEEVMKFRDALDAKSSYRFGRNSLSIAMCFDHTSFVGFETKKFFKPFRLKYLRAILDNDLETEEQIVKDFTGLYALVSEMNSLRIAFNSHMGAGGQYESLRSYKNLISIMSFCITEEERRNMT